MDLMTFLRSCSTVLAVLVFAGVVWWAYGGKRKSRFENAALSVLHDDDLTDQHTRDRRAA